MEFLKKFTNEHKLTLKTEGVNAMYLCKICNNLLYQPKIGQCRCRYCADCIEKNADTNECPSCKKPFKYNQDIFDDNAMKIKINKVIITCPNVLCENKSNVKDMVDHLKGCYQEVVSCIFRKNGCWTRATSHGAMHTHNMANLTTHLNMLIHDFDERENENKEKMKKISRETQELREQIQQETERINQKIDQETLEIKEKTLELREQIQQEAGQIKKELRQQIQQEIIESDKKMTELKMNLAVKFEELDKKLSVEENYAASEYQHSVIFQDMNSNKNGNQYFSEEFSIKLYTFKIGMQYHENDLISFYVCTVKSENNYIAKWPLANTLNLAITRFDGGVYTHHKFGLSTAPHKWKKYYKKPTSSNLISDSYIGVMAGDVIKDDNSVSVTLTLLN